MDVAPTISSLTQQLFEAKEQLKETDENIKKVTGRDASDRPHDVPSALPAARGNGNGTSRSTLQLRENPAFARDVERTRITFNDESASKRPRVVNSFHPVTDNTSRNGTDQNERRRGGWDDDEDYRRRKVQSAVVVESLPQKTREERIVEAQVRVGDKDVARNRRIFGSLMGTLKKFQLEQSSRAPTDDRQNEIRKKLEEKETLEKKEASRARRELFWERKRKQATVKFLETKVDIVKRFNDWELSQKPLLNFIQTEGSQPVFYLPKKLNKTQEEKLEKSRKLVEEAIQKRREYMENQLRRLDQKIEYVNRPRRGGPDVSVEDDIQETRKKMQEEPLDDIDVEALLDDNEVEGLELIAIDEQDQPIEAEEVVMDTRSMAHNGTTQEAEAVDESLPAKDADVNMDEHLTS